MVSSPSAHHTLGGLAQVYITSHLSDARASHVDSADEPGMCKQGLEVSSQFRAHSPFTPKNQKLLQGDVIRVLQRLYLVGNDNFRP